MILYLIKSIPGFATLALSIAAGAASPTVLPPAPPNAPLPVPKDIKAYDLDFNWGPGGPNAFAKPGLWADADPAAHVAWYKTIGANVIQTFCVSCNGYAWYKNGVVPEQPGLKHDFLPEVVKLTHRENMLVLGYFCAGSNTRWAQTRPELSYGFPNEPHIPYTDEYLAYLDAAIRDAVGKTGIDGFMVDWLRMPTSRKSNGNRWLECEKKLYAQLMGEPFPGEQKITPAKMTEYGRRAVDRCWQAIRKAAKETNPDCLVWLTCCDVNDPHIANSRALKETDWLLNEAGDVKRTADAKRMIGPQTRLITCLAEWNQQDPMRVVPAALKEGIGLYGFAKPAADSLLPLEILLARSTHELSGNEKNIAALARAFHGASLNSIRMPDGTFIEPLAPQKVTASSMWKEQAGYDPACAMDGDTRTRWGAAKGATVSWVEADFGRPVTVDRARIMEAYPELKRIRKFQLEYWDGAWKACHSGEGIGAVLNAKFAPVTAQRIRLNIMDAAAEPTVWEIQLFAPDKRVENN